MNAAFGNTAQQLTRSRQHIFFLIFASRACEVLPTGRRNVEARRQPTSGCLCKIGGARGPPASWCVALLWSLCLCTLASGCSCARRGADTYVQTQGIDLEAGGRNKKVHRTAPKSENVYLKLLVKVRPLFVLSWYTSLGRRPFVCVLRLVHLPAVGSAVALSEWDCACVSQRCLLGGGITGRGPACLLPLVEPGLAFYKSSCATRHGSFPVLHSKW